MLLDAQLVGAEVAMDGAIELGQLGYRSIIVEVEHILQLIGVAYGIEERLLDAILNLEVLSLAHMLATIGGGCLS